jgi:hypothetical protein
MPHPCKPACWWNAESLTHTFFDVGMLPRARLGGAPDHLSVDMIDGRDEVDAWIQREEGQDGFGFGSAQGRGVEVVYNEEEGALGGGVLGTYSRWKKKFVDPTCLCFKPCSASWKRHIRKSRNSFDTCDDLFDSHTQHETVDQNNMSTFCTNRTRKVVQYRPLRAKPEEK